MNLPELEIFSFWKDWKKVLITLNIQILPSNNLEKLDGLMLNDSEAPKLLDFYLFGIESQLEKLDQMEIIGHMINSLRLVQYLIDKNCLKVDFKYIKLLKKFLSFAKTKETEHLDDYKDFIKSIIKTLVVLILKIIENKENSLKNCDIEFITREIVYYYKYFQDYSELWLSKLLNSQSSEFICVFLDFFDKQNEFNSIKCLINSIMMAIENQSLEKVLIDKGLFKSLNNKLVSKTIPKDSIVDTWVKCFECLWVLKKCNSALMFEDIGFDHIAEVFREDFCKDIQVEIIAKTIKPLKKLVISKDYSQIITPFGIPLILEYLFHPSLEKTLKLKIKFERMLDISIKFILCSRHGLSNAFISNHSNTDLITLWRSYEKMFSKSISHNTSVKNLSKLIHAIKYPKTLRDKKFLLQILNNSLETSELNSTCSNYFYFTHNSYLSLDLLSTPFILKKEYSITLWVFPECKSNCVLFIIKGSTSNMVIKLINLKLVIEIKDSVLQTDKVCPAGTWSLISLNFKFKKMAKVVKSKKITIMVNSSIVKLKDHNHLGFCQKNVLKSIIIGNSLSKKDSFIGRISCFYVFNKRLKPSHFKFLFDLTQSFSLFCVPFKISQDDLKLIQELKDSLSLFLSCNCILGISKSSLNIGCDFFKGVSICNTIEAYDPKKFLIELIDACGNDEDCLTNSYEIILRLLIAHKMFFTLDLDFIRILGVLINSKFSSDRVNEIYLMMIRTCPNHLSETLFENYLEKISNFPDKAKYMKTSLIIFSEIYPFNRENFFKLCLALENLDFDTTRRHIQDYFENNAENKNNEAIPYVIIELLNRNQDILVDCILETNEKFNKITQAYREFLKGLSIHSLDVPITSKQILANCESSDLLSELIDNPWASIVADQSNKNKYKQEYDYAKYYNALQYTNQVLEDQTEKIKIRQVYDKYYRWPLFTHSNLHKKKPELKPYIFKSAPQIPENTHKGSFSRCTTANTNYYEKNSFSCSVEHIKIQGSYYGRLEITDKYLEIKFLGNIKPDNAYPGSCLKFMSQFKACCYLWRPSEISEIIPRRFIHQHTAFELILKTGKSYYINCFTESAVEEFINKIKTWTCVKVYSRNFSKHLKAYTKLWVQGAISNFEYLMIINKFAGRSNNDLSQYPVFPWILGNYTQEAMDYEDPSMYRKLNLPMGAQNESNHNSIIKKFKEWKESKIEPFNYGSHYSNSGIVTHYLLRIFPYTQQALSLQGGNFDIPDRLFYSIEIAWKSCRCSNGDVKEMVPELFYQYYAFYSYGEQTFGVTQDGDTVMHVNTPKWASSIWDFIKKHKISLESNHVSSELHNWIDLIFGNKQSGKAARNSLNVFLSILYEENFKKKIEAQDNQENERIFDQVYLLGQIPVCLFPKKPHPKKEEIDRSYIFENFFGNGEKNYKFKKLHQKNWSPGTPVAIFYTKQCVIIIKILGSEVILCKYSLEKENYLKPEEFKLEYYGLNESNLFPETKWKLFENFLPKKNEHRIFGLQSDNFLVSGMSSTNSIMIHTLKGKLQSCLYYHTDAVSCISCTKELIFSGSLDSTLVSWKWTTDYKFIKNLTYYGHSSAVTHLEVLDSYQILVSASLQNLVLIHDIRSSYCLKKISQSVSCLSISELGIIAIGTPDTVSFYGLNCEIISQTRTDAEPIDIKFNFYGDYCILIYKNSICFQDPTDPQRQNFLHLDGIKDLVIHPTEKAIFMSRNKSNGSSLYAIKQVAKT